MSDTPTAIKSQEDCNIPIAVANNENLVRAVFSNHLDKQKFRNNLFDERRDQCSVMRHTYMGTGTCRTLALGIRPGNDALKYKGMAVISASDIRGTEAEITDSRDVYCGHAHLSVGLEIPPDGDPLRADMLLQRDNRLRSLAGLARYFPDPDPRSPTWTGPNIH